MRPRSIIASVLGVALFAGTAVAQDTTRRVTKSDRRVQISKGEVTLPPRVDTVYVTRYDTTLVTRIDTVFAPRWQEVRVPVTRVDTVIVAAPAAPPAPFVRTPVYAALYTGMTMPSGNVDRLYVNGFHVGGAVGWDGLDQFLGMRFKGDIAQLSREQGVTNALGGTVTPLLVNAGVDAKVMPLHLAGWRIYGIGGLMASSYKGIASASEPGTGTTDGRGGWYRPVTSSSWRTRLGWNAGGGTDVQFGKQEMFIEGRVASFRDHGANSWFVPVSLGLWFF